MKSLVILLHIYFRSPVPCTATEAQSWFYIILSSKLGLSEQSAVTDLNSCRLHFNTFVAIRITTPAFQDSCIYTGYHIELFSFKHAVDVRFKKKAYLKVSRAKAAKSTP